MIGLESMTEANPNESSTAIFDWANKFHKAFRELKHQGLDIQTVRVFRNLICRDRFSFSLQAGPAHYSEPKAIAEKLKTPIGEMKSEIDKTTDSMGDLEKAFRKFLSGVDASLVINTKAFNEMMEAIEAANKANEKNKNVFVETGHAIKDGITKPLEKLTDVSLQITNILDKGIKGFSRGIAESIVLGKELNKTFKDLARTLLVEVLATMIEIIARKLT